MNKLTYRTAEEMQNANWTPDQIVDRIEDQNARPWLYEGMIKEEN